MDWTMTTTKEAAVVECSLEEVEAVELRLFLDLEIGRLQIWGTLARERVRRATLQIEGQGLPTVALVDTSTSQEGRITTETTTVVRVFCFDEQMPLSRHESNPQNETCEVSHCLMPAKRNFLLPPFFAKNKIHSMQFSPLFVLCLTALSSPVPVLEEANEEVHPIVEMDPLRQKAISLTEEQAFAIRKELEILTPHPLVRQNALTSEQMDEEVARLQEYHPEFFRPPLVRQNALTPEQWAEAMVRLQESRSHPEVKLAEQVEKVGSLLSKVIPK